MATTQNAGDLQLASTSPRMDAVSSTIDFADIIGTTKPENNATKNVISSGYLSARPVGSSGDIYYAIDTTPPTEYKNISGMWVATVTANHGSYATLSGQVTALNYTNYIANGTVSVLGFAQNQSIHSTALSTSLSVNSDGQPTVVLVSGRLACDWNSSTGGYSVMNALLVVGGVVKYNDQLARFVNSATNDYNQVSALIPVQIDTPGTGPVSYSLFLTRTYTGNGANGSIAWPTLQILGFKV